MSTQTVRHVSLAEVPVHASIAGSNVLYKVKHKDDASLKLKARIVPHGSEGQLKPNLKSDCSMCAPHGVRLLLELAVLKTFVVCLFV